MGAGHVDEFRAAGRTLFLLGLVKGSEGNLSSWDGERLLITRTGSALAGLQDGDVLAGTLDAPPEGASSDLRLHVELYRREGPGAVAHAHPPGTVPPGLTEGQEHGLYAHALTLATAVERLVTAARETP